MTTATKRQKELLNVICKDFPKLFGIKDISRATKEAFLSCPREHFINEFLTLDDRGELEVNVNKNSHMHEIYQDTAVVHWPLEAKEILSSNSMPSLNILLMEWLQVEPGMKILEIGSGGGWLAAMLGNLVGSNGAVVGVESIALLAEQSRKNLDDVAASNVQIINANAFEIFNIQTKFDRIVFTTSIPYIPRHVSDLLNNEGLLVAPILLRSGNDELHLFTKIQNNVLISRKCRPVKFVSAAGTEKWPIVVDPKKIIESNNMDPFIARRSFFGSLNIGGFVGRTINLFGILSKSNDKVFVSSDDRSSKDWSFGLIDSENGGLVVIDSKMITAYGDIRLYKEFRFAYDKWTDAYMPPAHALKLKVKFDYQTDSADFVEKRMENIFEWSFP